MPYLKHPELGNKHVSDEEAEALEAQGWTRFPRSKEAKALGPWPPVHAQEPVVTVIALELPIKRKPGRPKKAN